MTVDFVSTREDHEGLPVAMREAVDEFGLHLARIDNRSAHTVRAYVGDVVSLLDHAARAGCAGPPRNIAPSFAASAAVANPARTTANRTVLRSMTISETGARSARGRARQI